MILAPDWHDVRCEVTEHRWFRKPVVRVFGLARPAGIGSAVWWEEGGSILSGICELSDAINGHAQSAIEAHRAGHKGKPK
ncbi:hypothetical protein Lumi_112 [Xylophilus phage Lumi]|nr:hypothetical protein Lumi_112 [Xylophilus phage Lumi]